MTVSDEEVDLVRAALHRVPESDRRVLWQCLALIERTVSGDGSDAQRWDRTSNAINLAPQHLRALVAEVASIRFRHGSNDRPLMKLPPLPPTLRTTIVGRAADADVWTRTWIWHSFCADALADLADRRGDPHYPVPVLYRHGGEPLGLTKRFALNDNGTGLDVEAMLFPTRRAQAAGRYISDGLLRGLSPGVRVIDDTWTFQSPDEWEPRTGHVDIQRWVRTEVAELSLTPRAVQAGHARVRAWW
jgi:hypothetical protein